MDLSISDIVIVEGSLTYDNVKEEQHTQSLPSTGDSVVSNLTEAPQSPLSLLAQHASEEILSAAASIPSIVPEERDEKIPANTLPADDHAAATESDQAEVTQPEIEAPVVEPAIPDTIEAIQREDHAIEKPTAEESTDSVPENLSVMMAIAQRMEDSPILTPPERANETTTVKNEEASSGNLLLRWTFLLLTVAAIAGSIWFAYPKSTSLETVAPTTDSVLSENELREMIRKELMAQLTTEELERAPPLSVSAVPAYEDSENATLGGAVDDETREDPSPTADPSIETQDNETPREQDLNAPEDRIAPEEDIASSGPYRYRLVAGLLAWALFAFYSSSPDNSSPKIATGKSKDPKAVAALLKQYYSKQTNAWLLKRLEARRCKKIGNKAFLVDRAVVSSLNNVALKRVLNERGLDNTGQKCDLVGRLCESGYSSVRIDLTDLLVDARNALAIEA